ncbi:MAG: hypothetical protein ACK4KW_13130 [Gemmobacter sp.]
MPADTRNTEALLAELSAFLDDPAAPSAPDTARQAAVEHLTRARDLLRAAAGTRPAAEAPPADLTARLDAIEARLALVETALG